MLRTYYFDKLIIRNKNIIFNSNTNIIFRYKTDLTRETTCKFNNNYQINIIDSNIIFNNINIISWWKKWLK